MQKFQSISRSNSNNDKKYNQKLLLIIGGITVGITSIALLSKFFYKSNNVQIKKKKKKKKTLKNDLSHQKEDYNVKENKIILNVERRLIDEQKGHGMFLVSKTMKDINKSGDSTSLDNNKLIMMRAKPSVSVIFDPFVNYVCGFCFRTCLDVDKNKKSIVLDSCKKCHKFAICKFCSNSENLLKWHEDTECTLWQKLPDQLKRGKGDTSVVRCMLRYKSIKGQKDLNYGSTNDWSTEEKGKETIDLLDFLGGHVSSELLKKSSSTLLPLSKIIDLPIKDVTNIVTLIRTNACSIERLPYGKVGCALSGYVGCFNHDCDPNGQTIIDSEGFVCVVARKDVRIGEECTISYIDKKLSLKERKAILRDHYCFDCQCTRCKTEEKQ